METMLSKRGRKLVVLAGYKFYKNKKTKGGWKWRCTTHNCRAKLYLDEETTVILKSNLEHNHEACKTLQRDMISNCVKQKAIEDFTKRPQKLIKEINSVFSDSALKMNSTDIECIRKNIYRARRSALLPSLLRNAEEAKKEQAKKDADTSEPLPLLIPEPAVSQEVILPDDGPSAAAAASEPSPDSSSESAILIKQEIIEEGEVKMPDTLGTYLFPSPIPAEPSILEPVKSSEPSFSSCDLEWNVKKPRVESSVSIPPPRKLTEDSETLCSGNNSLCVYEGLSSQSRTDQPSFPADMPTDEPTQRPRDTFDAYGEYIASKLRALDRTSCAYVQKAIGDIIFEAEMGKYLNASRDSNSALISVPIGQSPSIRSAWS